MPLLKRVRVLAAKIESTPGTAESLSATDAQFNIFDAEIQAEIPMSQRPKQGSLGQLAAVAEGYRGKVTFKTEWAGDGAAGIPSWASTFFPAVGWVASLQVYSLTSEAPGSNVKTLTIAVYENGVKKQIHGAVGNVRIVAENGKPCMMEWEFTGVWDTPTDVAILSPTLPSIIPLSAKSATFTVGSWSPCWQTMTIDLGNEIILRECATQASGYLAGLITSRTPTITFNPEASLVATNDAYDDWINEVNKTFSFSVTDSTDTMTVASSTVGHMNVQEGDRGGNQVDDITLQVNNDDLTFTFA